MIGVTMVRFCDKCGAEMIEADDGATIRWYCENCGYDTWFARPFGDLGF